MRPRQIVWFAIVLLVGAALWYAQRPHPLLPRPEPGSGNSAVVEENHFSPQEDLERIDVAQIDGARRSLDVAMFAFTDRYVADALVRAAHRGVQVRIYRDRDQFEEEQRDQGHHGGPSTTEMFRGEPNIQVRIKRSRELMHLKSYCVDGGLLRDGSANWSPSGLKRQDNNARLTTDPRQVQAFEAAFDGMWARDNETVP
jgi:phosphatidylserine/phosphatidylglycerophosphate/cardiolipin synthase-like enzyme